MKKYSIPLICLIILISATAFLAPQVDKRKLIIQKWKVNSLEFPAYAKALETASPEQRKEFESKIDEMVKDSYFHFKKDSTYEISMSGTLEKGKWKLNPAQDKLLVKSILEDGTQTEEQQINIEELTEKRLVLINNFESGEIIKVVLSSK